MIVFHDYDPAHPFAVTAEKHIIRDNKITLNYAPLKGSVRIDGFLEDETGGLPLGTFSIHYGDEDNYRTADQIVHFPDGCDGIAVTVDYQGVSTLLRAEHMNEIRAFMETGASELAAHMIAEHEQRMMDALTEHCGHIISAIHEIAEAIAAQGSGGIVANDGDADTALDEYFPGDVVETGNPSIIAKDDEVDEVLDEFFPLPNGTADAGAAEDEVEGGGANLDDLE